MYGLSLIGSTSLFNFRRDAWDDITEYKEDFKRVIDERESRRIPFQHQSPQLYLRKQIVDYLKQFASDKNLSHCCLHLAVYLLDIFMDNHSIISERMLLVANVCLLLAAKFEEINTTAPKLVELNAALEHTYPLGDYKALEILILQFFHWYIMFPTAAHYIHYFIQVAIEPDDLRFVDSSRSLYIQLYLGITSFLDKIIDDVHFMQEFVPSKLAAAVISAARLQIGLKCWTKQLENFTHYTSTDIQKPLDALLRDDFFQCKNCAADLLTP